MRMFQLERIKDESGVSGTGVVAEGVEFSDGTCAMRWHGNLTSTTTYARLADLLAIHSHGGASRVRFLKGWEK